MASTNHLNPPFRAELVGSCLRPDWFKEKRQAFAKKEISGSEYTPFEEKAVAEIVKLQLEQGFRGITDGEYSRLFFWGTLHSDMKGIEEAPLRMEIFRTYMPDLHVFTQGGTVLPPELKSFVICTGKIAHPGFSANVDQFILLKRLVPEAEWKNIKVTLPCPEWFHMRLSEGGAYPKDVYKDDGEYFADIIKAYHTELDLLYEAGCRNIQIDDPNFGFFCNEEFRDAWHKDSRNTKSVEDTLKMYVDVNNACISAHKDKMHVSMHVCRGNFLSMHFTEGGYERVATMLFNDLDHHTYFLEYETERAGTFAPLAKLPKTKNCILGVVSSKVPELESIQDMKDRVYEAADRIAKGNSETREDALKRLGVSTQCGFASHEMGNKLTFEEMRNKLHLVREIANEIWPGQA